MARTKKTRKISDIMPARKTDQKPLQPKNRHQATRYELDAKAWEEKKKRKHKGLKSGARNGGVEKKDQTLDLTPKDPRIGSRKKVPLIVEEVIPHRQKAKVSKDVVEIVKPKAMDPMMELEALENNECLNQLLDDFESGKTLTPAEQKFVDDCLARIQELMDQLGLNAEIEDDIEVNESDLYRLFENIDLNQFK